MLKRNKKKEPEKTVFGEPIQEVEEPEDRSSFKVYVLDGLRSFRLKLSGLTPKNKIRIKYLLKFKRFLAGLLCVVYLCTFVVIIFNPISVVFLLTSFILLDYCWKTRLVKWISDEASS